MHSAATPEVVVARAGGMGQDGKVAGEPRPQLQEDVRVRIGGVPHAPLRDEMDAGVEIRRAHQGDCDVNEPGRPGLAPSRRRRADRNAAVTGSVDWRARVIRARVGARVRIRSSTARSVDRVERVRRDQVSARVPSRTRVRATRASHFAPDCRRGHAHHPRQAPIFMTGHGHDESNIRTERNPVRIPALGRKACAKRCHRLS